MKKILATAALLAVVASPALAATTHRHHPAASTMSPETTQGTYASANGYYAEGPASTDPDPFIRRSLLIEGDHDTGQ
ncbi:MAG TPA: hypothetical protein VHD59_01775 [Pseudolabrys sp.]|jgi:opacity protein-like surface antigen|nr:hypothetical protein [Pseudolabrys sp.]